MDTYLWIFIVIGLFGICLPWLKSFEKIQLINIPIIAVLVGIIIFSLPINLPDPDPIKYENEFLKLTELTVIISLMGAGLKINRSFSLKAYKIPLLLVVVTMVACIIATTLLGWWFGVLPASALLLGAVFSPTDPVLSSEVQVKQEEDEKEEHPVQFNLTAEAGLNDGMAFPFTWLAIWVAMYGLNYEEWLQTWIFQDVLYRVGGGILIGIGMGKLIAWLFFTLPDKLKVKPKRLGLLAVAATLFIYGITEAAHAYGFIAVFVASLTMHHYEKQHTFHKEMHDMVEQLELLLIVIILILLGGYIAHTWLKDLSYGMAILCFVFIFIIRPVFGILPMLQCNMPWKHRWAVAFLGIKGIGSFFYLAFALHETTFVQEELLWSTVSFLILISIVVHRVVGFYVKKKLL